MIADAAGPKNLWLLVQLRWLAIAGQFLTILLAHYLFAIELPMTAMLGVLAGLVLFNGVCLLWLRNGEPASNEVLFAALLVDVGCLSVLLYWSGGATNPFVSLFLLQVVLGAVLLDRWSSWVLVGVTSLAFALLTAVYRPLVLPPGTAATLFELHIQGMWVCFALCAVLLVLFVARIDRNRRERDADLATMQRRQVEEEHIVRIGLLASGAAHELGTPLSSLSVILGDWRRAPVIAGDPALAEEVREMQAEVQRCKAIVTNILLAAGEARGEAMAASSVRAFFGQVVADWQAARGFVGLRYQDDFGVDVPIASDTVLRQAVVNLLDNAAEASPEAIRVTLSRDEDALRIEVTDEGAGFPAAVLDRLGTPYNSTKPRDGAGLGLFLVANVVRTLGGTMTVGNRSDGAEVALRLPLDALALPENDDG